MRAGVSGEAAGEAYRLIDRGDVAARRGSDGGRRQRVHRHRSGAARRAAVGVGHRHRVGPPDRHGNR